MNIRYTLFWLAAVAVVYAASLAPGLLGYA